MIVLLAAIAGAISIDELETTPEVAIVENDDALEVKNRPIEVDGQGYISSENCRDCHTHHYDTWFSSHHRTMTQVPTKDSVIADFDNKVVSRAGYDFRFFKEDGEFFMEFTRSNNVSGGTSMDSRKFKIVLSTGAHHQQAFWCETENGRTLAKLPFIWINAEQRWVPYGSIFFIPKSGLSMHAGMWNSNCIKCHVVGGRPKLDSETKYDTDVAEFGISCEACHGPGETHARDNGAEWPNGKTNKKTIEIHKLVNPAKLSHEKSSQTCGQCHSVFEFFDSVEKEKYNNEGFAYRPGDDLHKKRHVFRLGQDKDLPIVKETLKRNPKFYERQFWSDGMVRVSGREYNGLLESPCYQKGKMSCLSCHDMHPGENDRRKRVHWADDQLKPQMRGNSACIQCHSEYQTKEQLVAHTKHSADSSGSNCYNCHMPHTTLGLMKAMRSHTVDSPNVATTLATGRPNACNLCHLDKTLGWTSDHLDDWYEIASPELTEEQMEIASSIRWLLKGDAGQRAIAGWHFGWEPAQDVSGTDWMGPYLAEMLTDSYDVVRFIGYHSLQKLPEFSSFQYDYVGSRKSQTNAKDNILKQLGQIPKKNSLGRKSLLIDAKGGIDKKKFSEIRDQRKDPPIVLIE